MITHDEDEDGPFDRKAADHDAIVGAKKLDELARHVGDDWERWNVVIIGWRALRAIAINRAGTNNMQSQAYRDAMTELLSLRKYSAYDRPPIDKQTRSSMNKLCNHIEEVTLWYNALSTDEKSRWKHPDTIAKHCPRHLLSGFGSNKPRPRGKPVKKRGSSASEDYLRQLLLTVIEEFVQPVNPTRAAELRKQLYLASGPDPEDDFGEVLGDNVEEVAEG